MLIEGIVIKSARDAKNASMATKDIWLHDAEIKREVVRIIQAISIEIDKAANMGLLYARYSTARIHAMFSRGHRNRRNGSIKPSE